MENNLALTISLIALALSFVATMYTFWSQIFKMKTKVVKDPSCKTIKCDDGSFELTILLLFQNRSGKAASINYVSLLNKADAALCKCELRPRLIYTVTSKSCDTEECNHYIRHIESAKFPININAYQSALEYVVFKLPKGFQLGYIKIDTSYDSLWVGKKRQRCRKHERAQISLLNNIIQGTDKP